MTTIHNQPPGGYFLIASLPDDPGKADLDGSPRGLRSRSVIALGRVGVAMHEPTPVLEAYLLNEMQVGGPAAVVLFANWCVNSPPVRERGFPGLDRAMSGTPGFLAAAAQFEQALQANLREQYRTGQVNYLDLVTVPGPVRFPGVPVSAREPGMVSARMLPSLQPPWVDLSLINDRVCKICIGSMQGMNIWIRDFRATDSPPSYRARLRYQIRDHFGVDDEDCEISTNGLHGTPGQVAMWVLQHHRRPGHFPWITIATVERDVSGSLR